MIGTFDDDGHTWWYVRLWPTRRHLAWCVERWSAGSLRRHLDMLNRSRRHAEDPIALADSLADEAGIYADSRCEPDGSSGLGGHLPDCSCRVYWVPDTTRRIRAAVEVEKDWRTPRD